RPTTASTLVQEHGAEQQQPRGDQQDLQEQPHLILYGRARGVVPSRLPCRHRYYGSGPPAARAHSLLNSSPSRLAPPTSAPSMLLQAINSAMLPDFTEPPYNTRIPSASSEPYFSVRAERSAAHTSSASAGVATRPVPIAQTGS